MHFNFFIKSLINYFTKNTEQVKVAILDIPKLFCLFIAFFSGSKKRQIKDKGKY